VLYGAQVSSSGGIEKAVDRAAEIGCDALQVFTQSSRTWRPTNHAVESLAAFRTAAQERGIGAALCHAIYFINLAAPEPEIRGKSIAALVDTTRIARSIGALGVVVHVGSHKGAGLDASLDLIAEGIRPALAELGDDTWLLLENSAGAGGTIGRDVTELARVIEHVDHPRLGLCLDTCHLYVSGIDVREPLVVDDFVERVDALIGLDRLRALHVNDAAAPLGSNRDRHAITGDGELGARLGVFLSHPAFADLPAVLETAGPEGHGPDRAEVDLLRDIHAAGVAARAGARS
jgi:deoxyribonuclease-4